MTKVHWWHVTLLQSSTRSLVLKVLVSFLVRHKKSSWYVLHDSKIYTGATSACSLIRDHLDIMLHMRDIGSTLLETSKTDCQHTSRTRSSVIFFWLLDSFVAEHPSWVQHSEYPLRGLVRIEFVAYHHRSNLATFGLFKNSWAIVEQRIYMELVLTCPASHNGRRGVSATFNRHHITSTLLTTFILTISLTVKRQPRKSYIVCWCNYF